MPGGLERRRLAAQIVVHAEEYHPHPKPPRAYGQDKRIVDQRIEGNDGHAGHEPSNDHPPSISRELGIEEAMGNEEQSAAKDYAAAGDEYGRLEASQDSHRQEESGNDEHDAGKNQLLEVAVSEGRRLCWNISHGRLPGLNDI